MTTRLLTRSGHFPGQQLVRDQLIDTNLEPVAAAEGVRLLARELPLFRDAADGLEQIVRVRVTPPGGVNRIEVLANGAVLGFAGSVDADGFADIAVPEITSPGTFEVRATVGDAVVGGRLEVQPQRKFTVHVVHHSHLDIGYTDTQGVVLRNQMDYLDAAVELGRQEDSGDPQTRFRWTVESNLPVLSWLDNRSASAVEEFCRLAREDVIEVCAMPFNLHTEAATYEEFVRLLRSTVELRESFGIPIRSAMHTDVPGATVGWVDALTEVGVRYLSAAHNWAGRSVPYFVGGQRLTRPFWWRAPSGARLLTWFTDSAHGMAYMEGNLVGISDSYARTVDMLPLYLHALATKPMPYAEGVFGIGAMPEGQEVVKQPHSHDLVHLRVQGDHSDNASPSTIPNEIARQWNAEWAYPRLVISTNGAFLAEAESQLGDTLAEHTGEWNDWWADGIGSGARPLGYNRRTQGLLRSAETLHTLADRESGRPFAVRKRIDGIYDKAGLFDEHTWGAANPWHDHEHGHGSGGLQWARKQEFAQQGYDDAQDLQQAGERRLGASLTPATDGLGSVVVHNTSGQPRTDVVRVFLPESVIEASGPLAVVDSRKGDRVARRVTPQESAPARPRGRHLEFVASDVPSLGWVRFDLVAGDDELVTEPIGAPYDFGNEFFEVSYDTAEAVITSIVDKRTGRQLVNADALTGLNGYIFDTYATAPHVNHLSGKVEAKDLSLFASRDVAANASVIRAEHSALADVLEVRAHAPGVDWIRTTITVYAGVPRVDIVNRISKQGSPTKESVYFSFPLAAASEPSAYEMSGSVAGGGIEEVPGGAQHMRAVRHWVGFSEGDYSTVWATGEAPLVQFGNIVLPYQPFPPTIHLEHPEPATIYSWALNNIWDTNFPDQQRGEMTFRYAVSGSPDESVRSLGAVTAAGLTDPLVGVLATGNGGEPVAASGSLLSVENPEVVITSVGHPLDGSAGIAVRLRSLAAGAVEAIVSLDGLPVSSAAVTTLLEQGAAELDVQDGRIRVPLPAGTSRTVLLR